MKWVDVEKKLLQDPDVKREFDALEWMMDIDNIPLDPEYKARLINERRNRSVICSSDSSDRLVADSVFKPLSV